MYEGRSEAVVDSVPVTIGEDCLFVVFPHQLHSYDGYEKQAYHLMIVDPELFPELSQTFAEYLPKSPIMERISEHKELMVLIELIRRTSPTGECANENALRGLGLAFLSLLLDTLPLEKTGSRGGDSLQKVLNYCANHYNEDLSLADLGQALHMSKYYVSHLFSEKFHTSFSDYINTLRLSEACRYLEFSEKSVTEIGELVGFGTIRTFNRVFKTRYGVSPVEYRQQREDRRMSFPNTPVMPKEPASYPHDACDCDGCDCDF
jgi:AraC-like DNA-binding protein